MLIKILPGEYLFNHEGFHVLDDNGFARLASEEVDVEVINETQLSIIQEYQQSVRSNLLQQQEQSNG